MSEETPNSVTLEKDGNVAVVIVNNPPVNALSWHVREGLANHFAAALADEILLQALRPLLHRTGPRPADPARRAAQDADALKAEEGLMLPTDLDYGRESSKTTKRAPPMALATVIGIAQRVSRRSAV